MKKALKGIGHWEFAKLFFFLFILVGAGLVFTLSPDLLPSAMISVLLFFMFAPIVDALERKGITRSYAILGLFLVGGLGISFVLTQVAPRVSKEVDEFQKGSNRYSSHITERLKAQEERLLGPYPIFNETNVTEKGVQWVQSSAEKLWGIAPNLASQLLVCLFLVPFLTFVLLNDAHVIRRELLKLVPNRYFETVYSLLSRILDEMGGYVAARILEAGLVTMLVTVGCLAAGIPYAILLGFFAGATNPIPYLGPVLGAIPGVLFALLDPTVPNQLLWVSLIFLVANLIDMFVIFPLVVAKIVDLHPVVVIISVMLGSQAFGILGMIVAVPITSILKILIQEIYSRLYHNGNPETSL